MKLKDLNHFKDEVAKEKNYTDFTEVWVYHEIAAETIMSEAAERYASHVAEQACRRQREMIFERLYAYPEKGNKENVLRCPLATE